MNRQSNGVALTAGASLIWGTSYVAASVGLEYSDAYMLLFERFLIASLAILAVGFFVKSARVWTELSRVRTWVLGAVYVASFLLQFLGQDISSASESALLSNLVVVFVPVTAYFVLQERLANTSKAAVALSLFGAFLVFPSGLRPSAGAVGDLLLVASSVGYTAFIVLGKRFGVSSLASTFAIIVSMAVLMAPVAFLKEGSLSPGTLAVPGTWGPALWLGVPCTVVALAMYTRGLATVRATQSATLLLLEIVMGVVMSVLLLGNVLSTLQVLGAALIGAALLLSSSG